MHFTVSVVYFWPCCTDEHIWLRKVQRWERETGKQTEGGRESEAVSLWGCKQREECGFHGNLRKAELWVSVPALTALHCTGPRLSFGSFLPSSPTIFFSLYFCCYFFIRTSLHPYTAPCIPNFPYTFENWHGTTSVSASSSLSPPEDINVEKWRLKNRALQQHELRPLHTPRPPPHSNTPHSVLHSSQNPEPAGIVLPCASGCVVIGKACENEICHDTVQLNDDVYEALKKTVTSQTTLTLWCFFGQKSSLCY